MFVVVWVKPRLLKLVGISMLVPALWGSAKFNNTGVNKSWGTYRGKVSQKICGEGCSGAGEGGEENAVPKACEKTFLSKFSIS